MSGLPKRLEPEYCPTPHYHATHRYCPSCSWVERPPALDEAMGAAAQLGAALARMENALDRLRKEGSSSDPREVGA